MCVGEKSQDVRRFYITQKVIKVLIKSILKKKKMHVFTRIATERMLKEYIINKLMEKSNNIKNKNINPKGGKTGGK